MKQYSLTEAAEALATDLKSLKRWIDLEEWDLTKQTAKYDARVKYLTEEQVQFLAKAHQRMWPPRPKAANEAGEATGLTGAVNILKEQVEDLQSDHIGTAQFTNTVKQLEDAIEELDRKYTVTLGQLTDALLALKDLQDWKTSQETKPKAGRKAKSPVAETFEYQAGLKAVEQNES